MENDADILGLGDLPRENNIQYKVGKVSLLCIESRSGSSGHHRQVTRFLITTGHFESQGHACPHRVEIDF